MDYAKDLFRYAKQFYGCLAKADLSLLHGFGESKRNHVMCALSNLSKFLGCYEEFRLLVRRFGLKWKRVNTDMLLLRRISRARDNSLIEWVHAVKERVPSLSLFLDFCFITGLRAKENINSWNLIRRLTYENRLGEYYNFESECLEHFRFRSMFIRARKRAFVSFIQHEMVSRVGEEGERVSWPLIHNRIHKKGLPLRFSDIREFWATYMLKWLNPAEIDFLQGRIGGSVFMRNYFNPALITDLKERVFKGIRELQKQL